MHLLKRAALLVALAALAVPAIRKNKLLTIASGTPVQVSATHVFANRLMIQPAIGSSTALVYVCAGIPNGTTPSSKCSGTGQLTAQLCAASATVPGCTYSDEVPTQNDPRIDLFSVWVDGDHTGDTVIATYDPVQ